MNMKPGRSPWTLLLGPASLIALLFLIWTFGYLYWELRIRREIPDLQRDTRIKLVANEPPSPFLHAAGSRALPALLRAMDDAVQREDRQIADLLYRVHCDAYTNTYGSDSFLGWDLAAKTDSLDFLRSALESDRKLWEKQKHHDPPWWMWWSGARRSP